MSINDTTQSAITSTAESGAAVSISQMSCALIAAIEGGTIGNIIGGFSDQSEEINTILSNMEPNLGQTVNKLI